uniref:Putative cation transporter n=1 Tax=Trypanosoma congolense (strain IL3000) TaxID=1068625 RepID=G0UTS6_TRYCI|nr:putative cation transporter [Trypanosoma congolense IL3000]
MSSLSNVGQDSNAGPPSVLPHLETASDSSPRCTDGMVQSIRGIYELFQQGALTQEEFDAAKRQILFPDRSPPSDPARSVDSGYGARSRNRRCRRRGGDVSLRFSSNRSSSSSSSSGSTSTVSSFMVAPRPRVWLPLVNEDDINEVNMEATVAEGMDNVFVTMQVGKGDLSFHRSRTSSNDPNCRIASSGSNFRRYGTFKGAWPVTISDVNVPKDSGRAPLRSSDTVFVEYFNCRGERGTTFSAVELKEHQLRSPFILRRRYAESTNLLSMEVFPPSSGGGLKGLSASQSPKAPSSSGSSHLELCLNWYWVDMVGRDPAEMEYQSALRGLTRQFNIAESFLLDREHPLVLPQICTSPEDPAQFLICLRAATAKIALDDDSVKELTNRWILVVDLKRKVLITIHRADSSYLANMRFHWKSLMERSDISFEEFLVRVMHDAVCTYTNHLLAHADILEKCEAKLFVPSSKAVYKATNNEHLTGNYHANARVFSLFVDGLTSPFLLKLMDPKNKGPMDKSLMNIFLYHLHRRASVHHRVLNMTRVVLTESFTKLGLCSKEYADEMCVHCIELIDRALEICDDAKTLLDMHLSLQSFRTNELMALLTKFSAFFTPSSFLAAVYGMNFYNIPEIQWEWGYTCFWGACLAACVLIYLYMYRRGLLE